MLCKQSRGFQDPGGLNQPCVPHDGEDDAVENQDTLSAICKRGQQLETSSQRWIS